MIPSPSPPTPHPAVHPPVGPFNTGRLPSCIKRHPLIFTYNSVRSLYLLNTRHAAPVRPQRKVSDSHTHTHLYLFLLPLLLSLPPPFSLSFPGVLFAVPPHELKLSNCNQR